MSPKEEAVDLINEPILYSSKLSKEEIHELKKQRAIITVKELISIYDTEGIGIDREIFKHYAQVINEIGKL